MESLPLLLGFLAIMYFVMIRPQQKRQKQHKQMLDDLSAGDDVITIGGVHGRVAEVAAEFVDLDVTDDVVLRFQKSAIARVVTPPSLEDSLEELETQDEDAEQQ